MGGNSCKSPPTDGKPITIAILGLDNAGKTTTAKVLEHEAIENVTPTIGFSPSEISHGKDRIKLIDLGGGKSFRNAWCHYYADAYGFVYVIDSSESDRMAENREVLKNLLKEEKVKGKPILILANKQDKDDAMDKNKILEDLRIERLVNESQSVCSVKSCTATAVRGKGKGMKIDENIRHGFDWLIKTIYENRDNLSKRIEKDLQERREQQEKEQRERKERVQKAREERKQRGEGQEDENDDDEAIKAGFVPIGQAISNAERNNPEKTNKSKSNRDVDSFRPTVAPRSSSQTRKPLPDPSSNDVDERLRRRSFDRSPRFQESPVPPRSQSSRFDDDDEESIQSTDDPNATRPTLGKKKKLIGPTRIRNNADSLPPLAPSSSASRREDFPLHKGPPAGTPRPSGLVAQWAITSPTPHQHPGAEKLTSIASDNELDADDDDRSRPRPPKVAPRLQSPHFNAKNRIKNDENDGNISQRSSTRKTRSRFDDDNDDDNDDNEGKNNNNNERIPSASRRTNGNLSSRNRKILDDDDEIR